MVTPPPSKSLTTEEEKISSLSVTGRHEGREGVTSAGSERLLHWRMPLRTTTNEKEEKESPCNPRGSIQHSIRLGYEVEMSETTIGPRTSGERLTRLHRLDRNKAACLD
ncbi:hypothetical protein CRG98_009492 [Punica granatum]|uniref:Uncharacterized protein n=1 Tax=Punica granatum TaxID=22663 RepID=A0A2I0KP68_PUNGR|nr:hypothetical protein CRG98_009492 [Punica granatum]